MKPDILFEDGHLLVLYKPAGVPVQSADFSRTDCVSMLKNYLHGRNPSAGPPYLGIVHRLDQPVEGLLVFALDKNTAASLSKQAAGSGSEGMIKTYLAVRRMPTNVDSFGDNYTYSVDNWTKCVDYLWKNPKTNRAEIVDGTHAGAKKAVLYYRDLAKDSCLMLTEIRLETGRFHQIRAQMAGMGTPIAGDRKYGPPQHPEEKNVDKSDVDKSAAFPALCAYKLSFAHPVTGSRMEFKRLPENQVFHRFIHIK